MRLWMSEYIDLLCLVSSLSLYVRTFSQSKSSRCKEVPTFERSCSSTTRILLVHQTYTIMSLCPPLRLSPVYRRQNHHATRTDTYSGLTLCKKFRRQCRSYTSRYHMSRSKPTSKEHRSLYEVFRNVTNKLSVSGIKIFVDTA